MGIVTSDETTQSDTADQPERQPYHVRLPGFIVDEDIGVGDVIKRATSAVGIRPCDDCAKRAALLNRWLVFTGRRSRSTTYAID